MGRIVRGRVVRFLTPRHPINLFLIGVVRSRLVVIKGESGLLLWYFLVYAIHVLLLVHHHHRGKSLELLTDGLSSDVRGITVLVRVVLRLGMCVKRGVVDGGDVGGIGILVAILLRRIDRIIRGGVVRFLTLHHPIDLFLVGVVRWGLGVMIKGESGFLRWYFLVYTFCVFFPLHDRGKSHNLLTDGGV